MPADQWHVLPPLARRDSSLRPPRISDLSAWWLQGATWAVLLLGGASVWSYLSNRQLISVWSGLLLAALPVIAFVVVVNAISDGRARRSIREFTLATSRPVMSFGESATVRCTISFHRPVRVHEVAVWLTYQETPNWDYDSSEPIYSWKHVDLHRSEEFTGDPERPTLVEFTWMLPVELAPVRLDEVEGRRGRAFPSRMTWLLQVCVMLRPGGDLRSSYALTIPPAW